MSIWHTLDILAITDVSGMGIVYKLYKKAVAKQGDSLTKLATNLIASVIEDGHIAITTGFLIPPNYIPETDGFVAALTFSRTFRGIFNSNFFIITEQRAANFVPKSILDDITLIPILGKGYTEDFLAILSENDIDVLIFVEKPGVNSKGRMLTFRGLDVTEAHLDAMALTHAAKELGIPTVGIGDRGNEVGMGVIAKELTENACIIKTDVLHVGATSNDALFSIETGICLVKKVNGYHSWNLEEYYLRNLVDSGFVDGVTGEKSYSVDSIPACILRCKNYIYNFFVGNCFKSSSTQSCP